MWRRSILSGVNSCEKGISEGWRCGTQIFTFSQNETTAVFGDEAAANWFGLGVLVLFTTYSHRGCFRPQVRSEFENLVLRCQDFSSDSPKIFPKKMLAVRGTLEICRVVAG
jgi:hypothetical protein